MSEISFIVPAMNEEEYIGKCLDSIKEQEYKEIIVVDGGSEDRTRGIVREKGAEIAEDPGKNASVARNIGAEKAEGEIYCFIDSDTILPGRWSSRVKENLEEDEVVAVGGPLIPKNPTAKDRFMYSLTTDVLPTFTSIFNFYQFQGPNMSFKADAFHEINGFRENLSALEDNEISNRIKKVGKVRWDRDLCVYESPRRFHEKGYSTETLKYLKAYLKIYFSSFDEGTGYEKYSEMDQ